MVRFGGTARIVQRGKSQTFVPSRVAVEDSPHGPARIDPSVVEAMLAERERRAKEAQAEIDRANGWIDMGNGDLIRIAK